MDSKELLEELLALAERLALDVRVLAGTSNGDEPPLRSGVCAVRGNTLVVLSAADPLADRVRVLTEALRAHAGSALARVYVLPALREHLDAAP